MINAEALRKIFELERSKGYDNTAVFGGLDKFLGNWLGQAVASITDPETMQRFRRLMRQDYGGMTIAQRQEWMDRVLGLIDEIEGKKKTLPPPSPKPKAKKQVKRSPKPKKSTAAETPQGLELPVTAVKGISTALAGKFGKMGVKTVRDLLYFFPHRHLDYSRLKSISELVEGEEQTIIASVWQAQITRPGGRRSTEAIVGDETGNIRVVWFNQPYLAQKLTTNTRIILSGKVGLFKGRHVFQSPEWELVEGSDFVHTARLVPVYSLTQGLRPRQVRKIMKEFIDLWANRVEDFLPEKLRKRLGLLELPQAISQAHYPEDQATKDQARKRLAFDELFILQLGVMSKKRDWQESRPGSPFMIPRQVLDEFIGSLSFQLTTAQEKALREILADLEQSRPMSRLLQGDVGSGKTVVATAALLVAASNDHQAAFMAPTEILAEQHFATIGELFPKAGNQEGEGFLRSYTGLLPRPITVALLIGDIKPSEKRRLQAMIAGGEIDIAIGTHALVQKDVDFARLGLVIVDEQHRFGVEQRSALRGKGFNPHMLVMTATPIPRTLALTLYGDLDLSVIDEMPPGRQTIKTRWLRPEQMESAYAFVRKQVGEGHQAFIICPLIEESEAVVAQAAVAEYERLSGEVFTELRLGLLHGRLSGGEKDRVMESFRAGEMDILVSTPVIEVGIDIPNATVMMVESADRFGLSQLHQFRGRVGRGEAPSYCILLAENPSEIGQERLDIIEKTQDGFRLAEEDLKLRGPGEFFGTRQSGLPDLRMARISDVALLELARKEAIAIFEKDPEFKERENLLLKEELTRIWPKDSEWS
jgi:ATP-dependent DNA helicase RecG